LGRSTKLLGKTWGEQLIGNFSFGLVFFVLSLPVFLLFALGCMSGVKMIAVVCVILTICYLLIMGMVQSTLQSIFQAVLYYYVCWGRVPDEFDIQQLKNSVSAK
jgi:hypothetical protein